MELHELNPFPVSIHWEGREITLKPFSLRSITWAERFFCIEGVGGFERMNRLLGNPENVEQFQDTVAEIIFHLSEGFQDFGIHSADQLKETIRKKEDSDIIFLGMTEALNQIFIESFPDRKEERPPEFDGKKKLIIKQKRKKEDSRWENIYAKMYLSGGLSLDKFYDLTMKQIESIMPEIRFIQIEDLSIESEIINKKMVYKRPQRQIDWSEDDEKVFEKMHEKLMEQNRIN